MLPVIKIVPMKLRSTLRFLSPTLTLWFLTQELFFSASSLWWSLQTFLFRVACFYVHVLWRLSFI